MIDKNWEFLVETLEANPNRSEIWEFLYNAPAIWSNKLLEKLKNSSHKWFKNYEEAVVEELLHLSSKFKSENLIAMTLSGELKYKTLKLNHSTGRSFRGQRACRIFISPDYKISISAGNEETINLWGLPDGNHIKSIADQDTSSFAPLAPNRISISPDSNILASRSTGNAETIDVWDLTNGNHIKKLSGHNGCVKFIAISCNNHILASVCSDEIICLWSLPDGNQIKTLSGNTTKNIDSLTISPDGKVLVSTTDKGTIRLWSLPEGNRIKTLNGHTNKILSINGHTNKILSIAISPNSRILVSCSKDKTICLWSLPDGKHLKTLTGHSEWVFSLAISADNHILVSGSRDETIYLWSLPDGKHLKTLTAHSWVTSLAISPYNHILASGFGETIQLWSLPDGKHLKTLTGYNDFVSSLSMSPDGRILASGTVDETLRLWDLSSTIAHITPINQFTSQNILEIESKIKDPKTFEDVSNAFKFILALIRLRQQFDIDIEDASDDIELSPFDIEIER